MRAEAEEGFGERSARSSFDNGGLNMTIAETETTAQPRRRGRALSRLPSQTARPALLGSGSTTSA
ncbi:MAG: hypothetical protein BGO98_25920 [Myxococcales bacterium 68-20]|nr:MAG: hypothetical protein BGO98_25920 [Myxococcales bacterium 68-20]